MSEFRTLLVPLHEVAATLRAKDAVEHGTEGRAFEAVFLKALRLLDLQFEEAAGATAAMWDIRPAGPGWSPLLANANVNIKIKGTRWLFTARAVYDAMRSGAANVAAGTWTPARAEGHVAKAVRDTFKTKGVIGTAFLKPKDATTQKAIDAAVRKKDEDALRALFTEKNFSIKKLGRSFDVKVDVDWTGFDAEGDPAQREGSWQKTAKVLVTGGVRAAPFNMRTEVKWHNDNRYPERGMYPNIIFRDVNPDETKPHQAALLPSVVVVAEATGAEPALLSASFKHGSVSGGVDDALFGMAHGVDTYSEKERWKLTPTKWAAVVKEALAALAAVDGWLQDTEKLGREAQQIKYEQPNADGPYITAAGEKAIGLIKRAGQSWKPVGQKVRVALNKARKLVDAPEVDKFATAVLTTGRNITDNDTMKVASTTLRQSAGWADFGRDTEEFDPGNIGNDLLGRVVSLNYQKDATKEPSPLGNAWVQDAVYIYASGLDTDHEGEGGKPIENAVRPLAEALAWVVLVLPRLAAAMERYSQGKLRAALTAGTEVKRADFPAGKKDRDAYEVYDLGREALALIKAMNLKPTPASALAPSTRKVVKDLKTLTAELEAVDAEWKAYRVASGKAAEESSKQYRAAVDAELKATGKSYSDIRIRYPDYLPETTERLASMLNKVMAGLMNFQPRLTNLTEPLRLLPTGSDQYGTPMYYLRTSVRSAGRLAEGQAHRWREMLRPTQLAMSMLLGANKPETQEMLSVAYAKASNAMDSAYRGATHADTSWPKLIDAIKTSAQIIPYMHTAGTMRAEANPPDWLTDIGKVGPWDLKLFVPAGWRRENLSNPNALPYGAQAAAAGVKRVAEFALKAYRRIGVKDRALAGPVVVKWRDPDDSEDQKKAAGYYHHDDGHVTIYFDYIDVDAADVGPADATWIFIHEIAHRVYYKGLTTNARNFWHILIQKLGDSLSTQMKKLVMAIAFSSSPKVCGGAKCNKTTTGDINLAGVGVFDPASVIASANANDRHFADLIWWWYKDRWEHEQFIDWLNAKRYTKLLPTEYSNVTPTEAWPESVANALLKRPRAKEGRDTSEFVRTVVHELLGQVRESVDDPMTKLVPLSTLTEARQSLIECLRGAGLDEAAFSETSVAVSLRVPSSIARQFPDKGDTDPTPAHVTILVVGDSPTEKWERVQEVVRNLAASTRPFQASLGDYGEFKPKPDFVVSHMQVESSGLRAFYQRLLVALREGGVSFEVKFPQFKPHITLSYGAEPWKGRRPSGSWTVDEVEVWRGTRSKLKFPLGVPVKVPLAASREYALTAPLFEAETPTVFWGSAGAGVLPVARSTGRVLVSYRSAHVNEPHTWGVFGGAIERGEDPKRAAVREMKEELGCCADVDLVPGYVFKKGDFQFNNFVGLVDEEFKPKLDWETEKAVWMSWGELVALRPKHFGLEAFMQHSKPLLQKHVTESALVAKEHRCPLFERSFTAADIPEHFFLLTNMDRALDDLKRGVLDGVEGIAGDGRILASINAGEGGLVIAMPGAATVQVNKLSRVMYDNPEYWVQDDFKAAKRILNSHSAKSAGDKILHASHEWARKKGIGLFGAVREFPYEFGEWGSAPVRNLAAWARRLVANVRALQKKRGTGNWSLLDDVAKLSEKDWMAFLKLGTERLAKRFFIEGEWLVKDKKLRLPPDTELRVRVEDDPVWEMVTEEALSQLGGKYRVERVSERDWKESLKAMRDEEMARWHKVYNEGVEEALALPPVKPGHVRLYRGTPVKHKVQSLDKADPYALFGPGIYLTSSKRIANDYTTKGAGEEVIFRYHGRQGLVTKATVIDAYIHQMARYMTDDGKVPFFATIEYENWAFVGDPGRDKRIKMATALWKKMEKDHEVRVGADGVAVIRRIDKAKFDLAVYDVPKEWLARTIYAEEETPEPVALAMYDALGRSKNAGEMFDYAREPDEDGFRPSFRQVYSTMRIELGNAHAKFRAELKERGVKVKGVRYAGGVTIGGAGRHDAFTFWDEQGLAKLRVNESLTERSYVLSDIPDVFRVVFDLGTSEEYGDARAWKSLAMGKLVGVRGISDSGFIEPQFFDIARNAELVMPGQKLAALNKVTRILYDNPNYMLSKDVWALRRVFQASTYDRKDAISHAIGNFLEYVFVEIKKSGNSAVWYGAEYSGVWRPLALVIAEGGRKIDGVKSFIAVLREALKRGEPKLALTRAVHTELLEWSDAEWSKHINAAMKRIASIYADEGEWVVKGDALVIPPGSTLRVLVGSESAKDIPEDVWKRYLRLFGTSGKRPSAFGGDLPAEERGPWNMPGSFVGWESLLGERGYLLGRLTALGITKKYRVVFVRRADFKAARAAWFDARDAAKREDPIPAYHSPEGAVVEDRRVILTRDGRGRTRWDWAGEEPFKESDRVTVYHGFRAWGSALISARFGLSGKEMVSRVYSYEADNNPKGLFVSLDFKTTKEFASAYASKTSPSVIIEFDAKYSELEAPVWPGGSYTVQGQMAQMFGQGANNDPTYGRRQATLAARAAAAASDEPAVAKSDRPEVARQLLGSEFQALYTGDLNPERVRALWIREESGQSYRRLKRAEFLKRYSSVELTHEMMQNLPTEDRPTDRDFKPSDEWDADKFVAALVKKYDNPNKEYAMDANQVRKSLGYVATSLHSLIQSGVRHVWPKQLPGFIRWAKKFSKERPKTWRSNLRREEGETRPRIVVVSLASLRG